MLDKFKTIGQSLVTKVADKASEVNTKVGQRSKKPSGGQQDQHVVGLDIGTEFVKALIGRVRGDTIEIIGLGRTHQELSDMQAGAIADISSVVANCDKALSQAEEQAGVSVRTAVIGIAGELVKGTTTTVRVTRKQPDKALVPCELDSFVKLVQEAAQTKANG